MSGVTFHFGRTPSKKQRIFFELSVGDFFPQCGQSQRKFSNKNYEALNYRCPWFHGPTMNNIMQQELGDLKVELATKLYF